MAMKEPYVLQTGNKRGQALEVLMFADYPYLDKLLTKIRVEGSDSRIENKLESHLSWLLARGENRKTKRICPYCKENFVEYFSLMYSRGGDFSISPSYTCCGNNECRRKIQRESFGRVYFMPFRFSVLKRFRKKSDQKRVAELFKIIFGLEKPLNRQRLFNFFAE